MFASPSTAPFPLHGSCGERPNKQTLVVGFACLPRLLSFTTAASAASAAAAATAPTAGGTAATNVHATSGSADETSIELEQQRAMPAPNTTQRIGPCFATEHADRKLLPQTNRRRPGDWRPHAGRRRRRDRQALRTRDDIKLDAVAVAAEEAAERKDAWRVKPWLSELDVLEWQELAGDRLGWREMPKSTDTRARAAPGAGAIARGRAGSVCYCQGSGKKRSKKKAFDLKNRG
jgi:hypothetical protein